MTSDIQVITINTEDQDIIGGNDVTFDELERFMRNNPEDFIKFDLGKYFECQNDENIGSHWSYLVRFSTREILNGMYNSQLGAL